MQNQNNETPEVELSEETIQAMKELGEILRGIHNRLISEGYTIKDGKIYKPDGTLNVPLEPYKPYQRRKK